MENFLKSWRIMRTYEKILLFTTIICTISIIILSYLQLTGTLENASNICMPLLGILWLITAKFQWKKNRKIAIFYFCNSIFHFICSLYLFIF